MLHSVELQHGDLHIGNILYDETADSVFLADFGLSRSSTYFRQCTGTTGANAAFVAAVEFFFKTVTTTQAFLHLRWRQQGGRVRRQTCGRRA